MAVKDVKTLEECQGYKFNLKMLARAISGLMKMLINLKVEPSELKTVSDIINSLVKNYTSSHYSIRQKLFYFGHVIPQTIQLFLANSPSADDFRRGPSGIVTYIMLGISTIT